MKNKLLTPIIAIVIIFVIIILILIATKDNSKEEANYNRIVVAEQEKSMAFSKEKQYKGLKITNGTITIDEKGKAIFTAKIKNESNEAKEKQKVKLKLLDRNGKTLEEIDTDIKKINSNETTTLKVEFKTKNSAYIYNFEIVEK